MLTCDHFASGGTGGNPPNPACEADPTQDASTVTDECAVFVSATAKAGGDGTKAKPYASLGEAVAKADGKRVLACTSEPFAESVKIEAGIEVIGGFDCEAEWTWSVEARSAIEAPANQIALTVSEAASGAKVRSFAIRAASATELGGSSIGVVVADVEAELAQVDVTAGDGMAGANGETPTAASQAGASASEMVSDACEVVFGGEPGVTMCQDGETRGGAGGLGGTTGTDEGNGQKGADGVPLPDPNPEKYGLGGPGQTDVAGNCRRGEDGIPGTLGGSGEAGSATTLTLAGITGGDGGNGRIGTRGQGGGGGGGAKAGLFCGPVANPLDGPGASGGGGGAGGCGGNGGGGGKAGGSSIGIVSLGTKLVLTEVTVAVGKAGKGGQGASGRRGADGGMGATGGTASENVDSVPGCDGGKGGRGGPGGPGGGGRGGHAVGIAYAAAPSSPVELKDFTAGTAGEGGIGGPDGNAGNPGTTGACWDFTGSASCGQ
ncbi:hypothetical protein [Sorangium atrum]|uniref:PE-PGRS family protein n=1 Tax=Sorangium atrum TaxID=2995308 RepID=A0ABT5C2S8_9BACT|nr:hypothetical protein [Sorangium aterium]MDC0680719.1 hypothetical protein [Sorangium aterium]